MLIFDENNYKDNKRFRSPAKRLRHVREDILKLSRAQLAEIIGEAEHRIRDAEGSSKNIPLDIASKMEEIFEIDFRWLMLGKGIPKTGVPAYNAIHLHDGQVRENGSDYAVIELDHVDLVRKFKNKRAARDVNRDLLALEQINPRAFEKAVSYIKGLLDCATIDSQKTDDDDKNHLVG